MKCPKCGKQNRKEVAFCEYCGAKLTPKKPAQAARRKKSASKTKKCPKCGSLNRAAVSFCENCGAALKIPPVIKAGFKVCQKCGAENPPNVSFCEDCGASLEVVKAAPKITAKKLPARKKIFVSLETFTQNLRGAIIANSYRAAFYALASICVILLAFTLFNSLFYSVTKGEARKVAQMTVQSLYPELQDVKPHIDSYSQNGQKYTAFTYTKNFSGQTVDDVQVEFSAGVVININRTSGEFEIMHIQ
jgi:uncharacterized membrane protein YvbJ